MNVARKLNVKKSCNEEYAVAAAPGHPWSTKHHSLGHQLAPNYAPPS